MASAIEVDESVQTLLKELEAMEGYSTMYFSPRSPEQPPPAPSLKRSVATPSKLATWKCPYCEESFTSRDGLRLHHRQHHLCVRRKRRNNRSSQPRSFIQTSAGRGPQKVNTCIDSSCINDIESGNAPEISGDFASPSSNQISEGGGSQNVSICADSSCINDNSRSVNPPELPGDLELVEKDSNDSPPTVSWVDSGYQHTVQNPANQGNVFLNIQLHHRGQYTHGCNLYLDENKDYEIYIMIMNIITRLENLWVDRYSGVPRVTGLTHTVKPVVIKRATGSNEGITQSAGTASARDEHHPD